MVSLVAKCTHRKVCLYAPTPGKFWISATIRLLLVQSYSKTERVGQTAVKPRNVHIYSTFEPNLHFGKMNVFDSQNFSTRKCDSGIQTSAATCGVVNSGCGYTCCCACHFERFGAMNLGPVAAASVKPVPTAVCYSSTVHRHIHSPLNLAARSIHTKQK